MRIGEHHKYYIEIFENAIEALSTWYHGGNLVVQNVRNNESCGYENKESSEM